MSVEKVYICEICNHKSDRLKLCHGKKMVESRYVTKIADNFCGC